MASFNQPRGPDYFRVEPSVQRAPIDDARMYTRPTF
jgi:hypothetical protein